MELHDDLLNEVVSILKGINTRVSLEILPHTEILTELDFDSLELLNLVETIGRRYGTDLLSEPYSIENLKSANSIAVALRQDRLRHRLVNDQTVKGVGGSLAS